MERNPARLKDKKFAEGVAHTQVSFNEFIAANNESFPLIKSIRERLIDYGNSVVERLDVIERLNMKEKDWKFLSEYKDKDLLRCSEVGSDIYSCVLTLPKPKNKPGVITLEMSFDKYLLHWGFSVYSIKWLVDKDQISGEPVDNLKEYVEECGLGDEIRENNNDEEGVVSLRTLTPTGDKEDDLKDIEANTKEILEGLLKKGKDKKAPSQRLHPRGNNYEWGKMFDEYRRKELDHKPDKIPTLLEVARIHYKENYISNILAFFFDEHNPHPLGNIFFRVLYKLATGEEMEEDTEITSVHREYLTDKNKRIDILIETNLHVVVIEAKIWARLYNDLEDYKKTADKLVEPNEEENRKERKSIGVVLHIEDNQLTKEEKERMGEFFKPITYREVLRKAAKLLFESNYSQLYDKDVDSLYLQLFFDLVTTIENLGNREQDRREFGEFLEKKGEGYWPRQAVLNGLSFYQSVMNKAIEDKTELELKEGFWNYFSKPNFDKKETYVNKRFGKNYAKSRYEYMPGRVLVYETEKCQIAYMKKEKIGIDTWFDWESGKWVFDVFVRSGKKQEKLVKHLGEEDIFPKLHKYKEKETPEGEEHQFKIEGKETLDETVKLLADLLQELITGIETKR